MNNLPKTSEGKTNWRAAISNEFLYVKPEFRDSVLMEQGVTKEEHIDISKVEDRKLRIKIGGINQIAHLRGIRSIIPSSLTVTPTEVTSICTVEFVANEDNPQGLTVGAQASASVYNVSGKFQLYLATIAQNRAFVRAVKQALQINILADDEVDDKAAKAFEEALKRGENPLMGAKVEKTAEPTPRTGFKPCDLVAQRAAEKGYTFEQIKERATEIYKRAKEDPEEAKKIRIDDDPATWTSFADIGGTDASTILDLMSKKSRK